MSRKIQTMLLHLAENEDAYAAGVGRRGPRRDTADADSRIPGSRRPRNRGILIAPRT